MSTADVMSQFGSRVCVPSASGNVIVCRVCKHGQARDSLDSHLISRHGIAAPLRKQIIQGLPPGDYAKTLDDLHALSDRSPVEPDLEVLPGFACRLCDFRTTSLGKMKRHKSKAHSKEVTTSRLWTEETMQAWRHGYCKSPLWLVDAPRSSPPSDEFMDEDDMDSVDEGWPDDDTLAAPRDPWELYEKPEDRRAIGSWLHRTRWHEHFDGYPIGILARATRSPAKAR
jgi:Orsellinic acid/F9775 biosynthesis cluster protein D